MGARAGRAARLHDGGYNCAQAVACAYADLVGADEAALFAATEGMGLGMGGMDGTCGALSGACVLAGLKSSSRNLGAPDSKAATYRLSRALVDRFRELSGATRCRDLKGAGTGRVLCPCPLCVENACRAVDEVLLGARGGEAV